MKYNLLNLNNVISDIQSHSYTKIFLFFLTDYPDYSANFVNYAADVKYEDGSEEKYRPEEHERAHESNGQGYTTAQNEEGEYDDRY